MNLKSVLTAITAVMLLNALSVPAFAENADPADEQQPFPNYISFKGKIKEIQKPAFEGAGYKEKILVQNDEGMEVAFQITDDTYFVTDNKAEVGANIIGFYDGKAPMIMIYPPQPVAVVIAIGLDENIFIKVDRFDSDLVSEDGQLKLNIGPDTKIVLQNNEAFDGDLTNRVLVVLYSVSTRSIPAQTTPEKIIVLFEKAVPPIYHFTEEDNETLAKASPNITLTLNDKAIGGPKPFVNENGVFMLPVRVVAEAMGLHVEWLADTRSVQIGGIASFTIGKDSYAGNRMSTVELGAAPVLKDSLTYVPLDFFTEVLGGVTVTYTPDSINLHYFIQD